MWNLRLKLHVSLQMPKGVARFSTEQVGPEKREAERSTISEGHCVSTAGCWVRDHHGDVKCPSPVAPTG